MTAVAAATPRPVGPAAHPGAVGSLGRLGRWTADHVRAVAIAWAVLALALGLFAPQVESALSGAGWQANGSASVQARTLIQANFAGLSSSALMVVVHSGTPPRRARDWRKREHSTRARAGRAPAT